MPAADHRRIERFLHERGLCRGPVRLTRVGSGHANLTLLADDGHARVVVRRAPVDGPPPGGHDMAREVAIQRAVEGSPIPVARVLADDLAGTALGAPAFVMEHVEGLAGGARVPAALDDPPGRRAVAHLLIDTLAALHALDWRALGLGALAPAGEDVERQLRGFAAAAGVALEGELRELLDRLVATAPAPRAAAIVHGDFRLANVMLAAAAPARIAAVLDWELATIGDPLRDLGYLLATSGVAGEPEHALSASSRATLGAGWPSREAIAARYGAGEPDARWYTAMAHFKLAVVFSGREGAGGFIAAARRCRPE